MFSPNVCQGAKYNSEINCAMNDWCFHDVAHLEQLNYSLEMLLDSIFSVVWKLNMIMSRVQ